MNPENPSGRKLIVGASLLAMVFDKFASKLAPTGEASGLGVSEQSGIKKQQAGFSIVTAIFLLVVLAFLGAAMVTFSVNQHQSAAMDVMGSRAYQAARAGVEWQAFSVLQGAGACAGPTVLAPMAGTLSGFTVTVTCALTVHNEANAAASPTHPAGEVWVYSITSVATQGGAPGNPNYVERQVQATFAR